MTPPSAPDLVAELLELANDYAASKFDCSHMPTKIRQAADEIERLRAVNYGWCDNHEAVAGCPGCIEAEYRRLRTALELVREKILEPNIERIWLHQRVSEALRGEGEKT